MKEFFQLIRDFFQSPDFKIYAEAVWSTIRVTVVSTFFAYVIGIPLGVVLYGTDAGGLFPNRTVNAVLGVVVNILRSIPFIVLLVLTRPVAKWLVGAKLGDNAFIVHLVIAAAPFVARMIESSLKEVNKGVIEAAESMGSTKWQIIYKVMIPEAKPSLITGSAIAITTILGYTPMTYLISGGGLGQLAILFGIYRFDAKSMYISSILLIILVQVMQEVLSRLARRTDHRSKK